MSEEPIAPDGPRMIVHQDRPLIGIISSEDDADTVIYFTDDESADVATSDTEVEAALALAGAWSDIPWVEIESGLEQIRHSTTPTPPLDL